MTVLINLSSVLTVDELLLELSREIITKLKRISCDDEHLWDAFIDVTHKGDYMFWHDSVRVIKNVIKDSIAPISEVFKDMLCSSFYYEEFVLTRHEGMHAQIDKDVLLPDYLFHLMETIAVNWPDEYELEEIRSGFWEKLICPNTDDLDICKLLDT